MRIVAVLNQKGGVGKTTTAVNLGAALALREHKVLLIDLDPQGNLTDHLGLEPEDPETDERPSSYDVLTGASALKDAVLPTATPGLFVVPSAQDLAAVELELAEAPGREMRLKQALEALPPKAYDWVLIDCPPSLGLLALNAMAASREVFITLQTEYLALKGLGQLDKTVALVKEQVNPDLIISGIVATLVDPVTNLAREVIDEVKSAFGHRVFETRIRKNVRLAEAPSHGTHIFAYAPASTGAVDYHALAGEVEAWDPVAGRAPATPPRARVPVAIPVADPVPPTGPAKPKASVKSQASAPPPLQPPAPVAKAAGSPVAPTAKPAAPPVPTAKVSAPAPVRPVAAPEPARSVGGRFLPKQPPAPAASPSRPVPSRAAPPSAPPPSPVPPVPAPKAVPPESSKPAPAPSKPAPPSKAESRPTVVPARPAAAAPPVKTASPAKAAEAAPPKPSTAAEKGAPARPVVPSPQLRHPRPWMKPAGK